MGLSAFALTAVLALMVARPVMILAAPGTAVSAESATGSTVATDAVSGGFAALGASAATPGVVVTVTPDTTRSVAPGYAIGYAFEISNTTSETGLFDLSALSSAGFDVRIASLEETGVASVALAAGDSTRVVMTVSVPASATLGTLDVSTLTATLDTSASVSAHASAVTSVAAGISIGPDNIAHASPNDDVTFAHRLVNSLPDTQTVALSYVDSHGWTTVFLAPDGMTEITSVSVGPYGGSAETLVQLSVPKDIATPATDTLAVTATTPSATAEATDTTYVRRLETYADAANTVPSSAFRLTDTIYARATGFPTDTVVCFTWVDPTGALPRVSATATVDASGTATDLYLSLPTDRVGDWRVELHRDAPDGELLESRPFTLTYKGEITELSATDGANVDETITVSSSGRNDTSQEITGSVQSYLIWWDADGDGAYGPGDTFIDATGAPQPYSAEATTHVTAIASVPASGTWTEPQPWPITNALFPNQGTYNVTATWRSSAAAVIDTKTSEFYAVPTLGWIPLLLMAGFIAYVMWRRRPVVAADEAVWR
jgi:hypothetical protein